MNKCDWNDQYRQLMMAATKNGLSVQNSEIFVKQATGQLSSALLTRNVLMTDEQSTAYSEQVLPQSG